MMFARHLGRGDGAQLIERLTMQFRRGFEHRMIGRRALSSSRSQNQNAGDLCSHLAQILETFSSF